LQGAIHVRALGEHFPLNQAGGSLPQHLEGLSEAASVRWIQTLDTNNHPSLHDDPYRNALTIPPINKSTPVPVIVNIWASYSTEDHLF